MSKSTSSRLNRKARLEWVPLGQMKINLQAQGDRKQHRVDFLVNHMIEEELGAFTVSLRNETYFVVDGQHRREALMERIGDGWEDFEVQCWTYFDLTEAEEAEKYLLLADHPSKRLDEKFAVALTAGRPDELDINRIVQANGQNISRDRNRGITSIGKLQKVYGLDPATLGMDVRIVDQAWGTAGFDADIILGIGHFCHRYNGRIDEPRAIKKFGNVRQGHRGLLEKARLIREQLGKPLYQCVAAAATDVYNKGPGGKLPGWWAS